MMCEFRAINGDIKNLDLNLVYDVAIGYSTKRNKWTSTIVYDIFTKSFVELRSSPPDYKGNSLEEAE